MSAAPGLDTLFELSAIFDRGSRAAPDDFLVQILPEIAARIPHNRFTRLYTLGNKFALLLAATDNDLPRDFQAALADFPSYVQAIDEKRPIHDATHDFCAVPLVAEDIPLGLLEIGCTEDLPQTPEMENWLRLLGGQLAYTYKTVVLRDLLQRQTRASVQLTQSRTFTEMAGAIGNNMLVHKGRFVTINIAEYDVDDTFARLRVVASANRRESYTVSSTIDLGSGSSWGVLYRSIESNEPAVINHIEEDENISQDVRDWLAGFDIKSVFSLPLRHQNHTYGFLGINDTRGAIILSAEEMRVYQQLADQLSALIQIHNLVEESTYVSEISEHQAQAFAELRTGQDFVEMAGIIGRHMLQVPGRLLSLNKLIYNSQGQLEGWQTVATANRDQARAWEGEQAIDLDAFGSNLVQSVQDGVPYVINDANAITPEEIGEGFYNWIKKYQFKTLLNVPVMVDQIPVACLCVFGTSRRPFSTAEIHALNNLCDQIGILIHTNNLLREAEAARSQANDIVLASRLIKIAEDHDDMAQAVIYTLGKGLTAAGLVLFDQALGGSSRPGYRSLVTLVTAEGADETDSTMPFDRLPEPAQLDSLMNGLPIITTDLYADTSYITPGLRRRFIAHDLTWGVAFGLRAGDQLLGSLELLHTTPYPLTAEEIDAFTALADQIGLALHSRRLISESREAQSLANQLVQTNRQIALMSKEEELAQALIHIMPESVSILSIARFDHPLVPGDVPDYLETRVIVTRTRVTDMRTIDHIHVGATELYTTLDRLREGEIIQIPDIRHYRALLTPNMIALLQQQGIYHIITLGLRTGNRLLGTMTLGGERTLPTGSQQLDNFRVIADQVAITLDNRLLLNQTAESLDFLQTQYHTANTIHRSEDMVEILSSISQFIGQKYENGRLGLIDTSVSLSVVHIVAELDHGRSRPANRYVPLNSFPAWDTLAALETLYVQDTANDDFLTPEERDMLTHQGIGAMIIVPLVASQQLLGVVIFNHATPVVLDQRYLRAMRNLGDQLAIVLENSTLLHSTAQTLEETQLLYEVTRSILSAQDTLDVLRALRSYLSPEATLINHFTSTTDENRVIRNIVVDYVNSPEDERVVQVPLEQMMGTAGFADFVKALNADSTTLEIAEDLQADGQSFMLRDFALLNGFRSYIHFIIRERGRVQEMVSINFTTPQVFPETQRRLFRALSDQIGIVLQNHRLLRETQVSAIQLSGQVESMRTLNEIAIAVSTLRDQEKLLNITITSLVNLLKVDHGGVVLIDSSGQVGTVINEYPDHGAVGVKFDIPSHPIFAMMAENNFKPIVINDVDNHPRLNDVSRKSLRDLGVKSVMLLAIAIQGEIIGSLGLDLYTAERTFSPDMVKIAETVTAQVATGLQNMRLLQDTQRRAEQLQHIAAFGQTAQSTLDLYAIFRLGLETSGAILTQDRVRIALYDEESGNLQVAASRVGNQLDISPEGGELIPITGYIATVWETRNLLHISDLHAYPRDPQVDARSRDWIVVPMISQGRILGMVSTGSTVPHVYTQTDVVVFQQFVNQLGAAIENSRTYMQSQRTAHNEAFINEISTNLQRQRDIQSMLDVTVQQLGKELGARRARIRLTTESITSSDE